MGVTVSMHKMNAGGGYKYLLTSVAAGDGNRSLSTPLTRYYTETGTPPGRWMGTGVHAFGNGELTPGDRVSEEQLGLLLGSGHDPVTGQALGRAYPQYTPVRERIQERLARLNPSLTSEERAAATARIKADERQKGNRRAVAGFDFTFSAPKSVSTLWALADSPTRETILAAHHAAVADVLRFLEREVAATRTGTTASNGAVAQVDVTGVAATAFDHWDSREHDPQLHTHVVVSNKVQTILDGKWRSLDSRPLHGATVAMSELYNAVLADRLTRALGVGWDVRERGSERNPQWEITGVPEDLLGEFSRRSRSIEAEKDELIDTYIAAHSRRPSTETVIKLRAQATLATRPDKTVRSLADLTTEWQERAAHVLGPGTAHWANDVVSANDVAQVLRASDIPSGFVQQIAADVVDAVSQKRPTWRHWNLYAEAARQTMGWRFATIDDREAVIGTIVETAEQQSVTLTPPELATSPNGFRRGDGTSVFRPRHCTVYTSRAVLDTEDRLLARADDATAPAVKHAMAQRTTTAVTRAARLSEQQAAAITAVATSGRQLDVLVGPAGAGKTTTMNALKTVWQAQYGTGSVVGLAPSAAAAQVLAQDLGIACENTAKWLHEHDHGRATFAPGQLVIVDEASLADTRTIDRITGLAAQAAAKVLLVGDPAQLQSVNAGGAFGMLIDARPDAPKLGEVHRFTHAWEKITSLHLRQGDTEVIDTYGAHGRLIEGTTEQMQEAAYTTWLSDSANGLDTVLITQSVEAMRALNDRARAGRILSGTTRTGREVDLAGDSHASTGDVIITRRNHRRLRTTRGDWVRNGDRWTITHVHHDGSVEAEMHDQQAGGTVVLPAAYVAEHVDLGYAVTAHRAQGMTVDTSHTLVSASTTRENLYVAMTRGRDTNLAYVALDQPDNDVTPSRPDEDVSARTVLSGVLQNSGVELSAHQTITAEQERWSTIAQLAAEYETIAATAQRRRWTTQIKNAGLTAEQADDAISSEAFGPLTATLRHAEAYGHDVDNLLPQLVSRHGFDDIAAVLHHRLTHPTNRPARGHRRRHPQQRLIAGLIPEATGPMTADMREALSQRRDLIESRARALAQSAVRKRAPWTRRLGEPPVDRHELQRWMIQVTVIAAYRDRYQITSTTPLGANPDAKAQRQDAERAAAAVRRAATIATQADANHIRRPAPTHDGPAIA
jgi:conjugative relaxase-like TrwC/TraI family protein